ncbi:LOW QUALITY PROTEIN: Hypothetical protein PHPALM_3110 [Phytophthora palmivora]|uniref:Uncharacterized protein n=1 Tax=Phytophthora palmivora TaxID=4796 RepID=A0A2P4YN83_9STRA|nr:LOW QUALITY PROTEIN: Hypothetical protein PHPALM_3110 [Phytophthora palmivora]
MTPHLKADLLWWKELVFEIQFVDLPEHDDWVITRHDNQLTVYNLTPRRIQQFTFEKPAYETEVTWTILQLVEHWVNISPEQQYWRHIRLYVQNGWEYRLLDTMHSRDPEAQQHLKNLALAQARRRLMISVSRVLDRASETMTCDVHQVPDLTIYYCLLERIVESTSRRKRALINSGSLRAYEKRFRHWEDFCNEFGQARIVGLFAGLCALEGHNSRKQGNKYQTFDGKIAAVAFAHKSVRNARINYKTPEFELIARGFKRTNSNVERKQPVTAPMLLEMHRQL